MRVEVEVTLSQWTWYVDRLTQPKYTRTVSLKGNRAYTIVTVDFLAYPVHSPRRTYVRT